MKLLARHLESGEPARARATWAQWWRRLVVVELGYFPTGKPAPEYSWPKGIEAEQAPARFGEMFAAMDEVITRCEQKFGGEVKIASHATFGPLTARQWRKFHLVHTRHHAKQVEALRVAGGDRNM
jgi:hypothetical protein